MKSNSGMMHSRMPPKSIVGCSRHNASSNSQLSLSRRFNGRKVFIQACKYYLKISGNSSHRWMCLDNTCYRSTVAPSAGRLPRIPPIHSTPVKLISGHVPFPFMCDDNHYKAVLSICSMHMGCSTRNMLF